MINTLSGEEAWLHQDTTMFQVQECIRQLQEKSSEPGGEWKFELRIRYLPLEWAEVYETDNLTFMSYYNQVCTAKTHNVGKSFKKVSFLVKGKIV